MNITLPSHENFPEMFVSTWVSTTCEAFDNVVYEKSEKLHFVTSFCTSLRFTSTLIPATENVFMDCGSLGV